MGPNAIWVTGNHPKAIGAWREICVRGLPGRGRAAPLVVKTIEQIAITDPLRTGEVQPGKTKSDPLMPARNVNRRIGGNREAIRHYRLDVNDWRGGVSGQPRGVHNGDPAFQGKPDSPRRIYED